MNKDTWYRARLLQTVLAMPHHLWTKEHPCPEDIAISQYHALVASGEIRSPDWTHRKLAAHWHLNWRVVNRVRDEVHSDIAKWDESRERKKRARRIRLKTPENGAVQMAESGKVAGQNGDREGTEKGRKDQAKSTSSDLNGDRSHVRDAHLKNLQLDINHSSRASEGAGDVAYLMEVLMPKIDHAAHYVQDAERWIAARVNQYGYARVADAVTPCVSGGRESWLNLRSIIQRRLEGR